ncbi:MAG: hypothetical protein RI967_412, partial [Planctomycetota bacterium]
MQRSTKFDATFISTQTATRAPRTVASLVAVALVGATPWMASWSSMTLAQDAPNEPAPQAEPAPAAEPAPQAEPAADAAADAEAARQAAMQAAEATRAEARDAMQRNDWKKALDLWSGLLGQVPADGEAMKGMKRAQAMLDQGTLLDDASTDMTLRRQRAEVETEASIQVANDAISVGDYTKAERTLIAARLRLERDVGVFPRASF